MFENLLEIQAKIQNATNRVVEDAMHGLESVSSSVSTAGKKSTSVLKKSFTGGNKRGSNSNNHKNTEVESRDIHSSPTSARKATFFDRTTLFDQAPSKSQASNLGIGTTSSYLLVSLCCSTFCSSVFQAVPRISGLKFIWRLLRRYDVPRIKYSSVPLFSQFLCCPT